MLQDEVPQSRALPQKRYALVIGSRDESSVFPMASSAGGISARTPQDLT